MKIELGPFLCKPTSKSMGFWFSSLQNRNGKFRVEVTAESNGTVSSETFKQTDHTYGVFLAEVSGLKADDYYTYKLFAEGDPSAIPLVQFGNKSPRFRTLPEGDAPIDMGLVSCNGIEAFEKDVRLDKIKDKQPWDMWARFEDELSSYPNCRLIILGGDQVYMDDMFEEKINDANEDETWENSKGDIYKVYEYYWRNDSYRRILGQIPSMLMWDDHDLNDGWGSRPDLYLPPRIRLLKFAKFLISSLFRRDFKINPLTKWRELQNEWRPKWKNYGLAQKKAFKALQASRNSAQTDSDENGFSFLFKHGGFGILGLDLRSHRDAKPGEEQSQMLTLAHKVSIEKALENAKEVKTLFVLSPVTIARMGGKIEGLLGGVANFVWRMGAWISYGDSGARVGFWWVISTLFILVSRYNPQNLNPFRMHMIAQMLSIAFLINIWLRINTGELTKSIRWSLTIIIGILSVLSAFLYLNSNSNPLYSNIEISDFNWAKILSVAVLSAGVLAFIRYVHSHAEALKSRRKIFDTVALLSILAPIAAIIFTPRDFHSSDSDYLFGLSTFVLTVQAIVSLVIAFCEARGISDELAGLDDDVKDGWSSDRNRSELIWLTKIVSNFQKNGRRAVVLSGDIHTGGLTYLDFKDGAKRETPQVTSSPISYVPMPALVEKVTSSTKKFDVPSQGGPVAATNVFFICQRNFVIVRYSPAKIGADYYFEDMPLPLKFDDI